MDRDLNELFEILGEEAEWDEEGFGAYTVTSPCGCEYFFDGSDGEFSRCPEHRDV